MNVSASGCTKPTLDVYIGRIAPEAGLALLTELFDVVLKKCHWLDGKCEVLPLELPELPEPDPDVDGSAWEEIRGIYNRHRQQALRVGAPYAVVHGDLHPKNVLITRNQVPVLIDFSFVKTRSCVYMDYAKFEVHLQFQVPDRVASEFRRVSERVFSAEPLILPRSRTPLASYIHMIRSILWRDCLSNTIRLSNDEIDLGYRGYLLFYLARLWSKTSRTNGARDRAYAEIRSLSGG